jgi:hypothetical protein
MRLCVVTHTFPPSTHANAKRPHYLVRGFLEAGWEVEVFTQRTGMPPGAGETVAHPALHIVRLEDPIEKLLRRTRSNPLLYRMVALSLAGVMWPDVYARWANTVYRRLHAGTRHDRTLAFVLPASVLLSGRYRGLVDRNWTFDYQESVTPQYRKMKRRSPVQKWLQPRLEALERDTLHQAGRVVFTADTNRQAYVAAGLVDEATTAHVPYFFDAVAFGGVPPPIRPGFEVVYFGTFDWHGARSPETFLRALAAFLARTPEARPHTRFSFYGHWLAEHHRFVEELDLRNFVTIHPPLGYGEYLTKLRECPVLLLVVAPEHNLFMPSKIVDYFGAGRPIMAFVPPDSEMHRVLDAAGMLEFVSAERDLEGGVRALEKLWARHRAGTLTASSEQVQAWSSEALIPRYVQLVEQR